MHLDCSDALVTHLIKVDFFCSVAANRYLVTILIQQDSCVCAALQRCSTVSSLTLADLTLQTWASESRLSKEIKSNVADRSASWQNTETWGEDRDTDLSLRPPISTVYQQQTHLSLFVTAGLDSFNDLWLKQTEDFTQERKQRKVLTSKNHKEFSIWCSVS